MKTHLKKLRFVLSVILIINSTLLFAQDVKSDRNNDKVTIENIQPVCPDLPKEKKPGVTVANFKLNVK